MIKALIWGFMVSLMILLGVGAVITVCMSVILANLWLILIVPFIGAMMAGIIYYLEEVL